METSPYDTNQIDYDLRLPPRKRLLAGYMKLNGSSSSSSSSTTSYSNGSSSSSVSTSRFHQNQSPEELVEAARSAAAEAVKAAKAARALANEKALVSSKAIAAAKRALELVESFPKEAMSECKERYKEEDLARRLQRAIDRRRYPTREDNGQINKKQKVTNGIDGVVVDSDSSYDGLESNKKAPKAELDSIPTPGKERAEEKRRERVKIKKFHLSICNTMDQENGVSCASPVLVAQPTEDGVVPSSRKCQDLKAPESVKQNKALRS